MFSVMPNAFTTCSFVLATAIHSVYAELQHLFKQCSLTFFSFVNSFQPCFLNSSVTLGRLYSYCCLSFLKKNANHRLRSKITVAMGMQFC